MRRTIEAARVLALRSIPVEEAPSDSIDRARSATEHEEARVARVRRAGLRFAEIPTSGARQTREFEEFYRAEFPAVVGLAYALSGTRAGAEDLAQEAFLAAHRSWGRIREYDKPEAWVRRVVSNLSVSFSRRRLSEAKALAGLALRREPTLPPLDDETAEFWAVVRSLPRRQAQVVALHYLEDLPVTAIAEILGIAEGSVKAHLHAAREHLAALLQAEEGER